MFAMSGVDVLGVDSDVNVVSQLLDGRPRAVESEIRSLLGLALHSGSLQLSTELEPCGAYIVCVPTPVGKDHAADLSYVESALDAILPVASSGELLIVESTIPPGTMQRLVLPRLKDAGLAPGRDFFVAYCPERVLPGATMIELIHNDKVIGGLDRESAKKAAQLYSVFVKGRVHLTQMETAEFVKVVENTYRDVNIALANEFAKLADYAGVDVWETIRLANNHPRVNVLRPGPGVGGHCVAVDPWFLVQLDESRSRLVRSGREVNDGMPRYIIERLTKEVDLQRGHVALLGLAYRADLGDIRESPALAVYRELRETGVSVKVHDPLVTESIPGVENVSLMDAVTGAAVLLIVTDHAAFRALDPATISEVVASKTAFDTRDCLDLDLWNQAGFQVLGLGRATRDGS